MTTPSLLSCRKGAGGMLVILLLCSCSPRIIEHTIVQRDTTYLTTHVRDSVYFRDSIYIKESVKGDTIRITEYRDRWRERIKEVHDTTYIAHRDTIATETIITEQVEQPIRGFKKLRLRAFLPLLLLCVIGWRKEIAKVIKRIVQIFS